MSSTRYLPLAVVSLALLTGCPKGSDFVECRDDTSCGLAEDGRCLVNPASGHQFCAYPDSDCPGGMRWSELDVEDSISGMCVGDNVFDAGVDSAIDADTVAPTVVSVTPSDGATMVSTTTVVSVVFSEAIDESSVTSTTFQVTGPGGPVPGSFNIDGATVNFAPSARLDPDVDIDVNITTGVTDLGGNPLQAAFSSTFSTRAGGWTDPALLELDTDTAIQDFDATMRAGGRGAVIWIAADCADMSCGAPYTISASIYGGGTFAAPELIETEPTVSGMTRPRIAIDGSGNAMAAWLQPSGSYNSVWTSRRPSAGSWSAPALIEAEELGHAANLRLSGDAAGNVYAVWQQNDGSNVNVWANRYTAGGAWGTAVKLEAVAGTAFVPNVAATDDGTAIAVWLQNSNVYFARYSGTWSAAAIVGTGNAGTTLPIVRTDSNGGVIAAWRFDTDVLAARYTGAWTVPAAIDASGATVLSLIALATSTNGKALAIWSQGPSGSESIYQSMYDGTDWNNAFLLEQFAGTSNYPSVAFGTGDRAMAVFDQTSTNVAWSAEHRPALLWQPPETILDAVAGIALFDDQRNVFINVFSMAVVGFKSMYFTEYE